MKLQIYKPKKVWSNLMHKTTFHLISMPMVPSENSHFNNTSCRWSRKRFSTCRPLTFTPWKFWETLTGLHPVVLERMLFLLCQITFSFQSQAENHLFYIWRQSLTIFKYLFIFLLSRDLKSLLIRYHPIHCSVRQFCCYFKHCNTTDDCYRTISSSHHHWTMWRTGPHTELEQ